MSSTCAAESGEVAAYSADISDGWHAVTQFMQRLHDGPVQLLALALLQLDKAMGDDVGLRVTLGHARGLVGDALRDMRCSLETGRDGDHDEQSTWGVALTRLGQRFSCLTGQPIALACDAPVTEPPPPVAMVVWHAAQELLSNACKHAPGARIEFTLMPTARGFELTVQDNGPGFDPDVVCRRYGPVRHMGLGALPERLAAIGAALELESYPGAGVRARIRWPAAEQRPLPKSRIIAPLARQAIAS